MSLPARLRRWTAARRESMRLRRKQELLDSMQDTFSARGVVVSLADFQGEFELNLRSHVTRDILLVGGWEPRLVMLLKAALSKGQHVIDIGANAGLYTVLMARLIGDGRLLAIEPAPSVLPLLRANIARNQLSNVEVFPGVATSKPGTFTLYSAPGNEEYSSLAQFAHPNAPRDRQRTFTVDGATLDDLTVRFNISPTLLKIDVEGAEGHVFRGATRVLHEHRPLILSEFDNRLLGQFSDSSATVGKLLAEAKYQLWDAYSGTPLSVEDLERGFVGEIAAIPAESLS
jgi:FkbM family methyltransferase